MLFLRFLLTITFISAFPTVGSEAGEAAISVLKGAGAKVDPPKFSQMLEPLPAGRITPDVPINAGVFTKKGVIIPSDEFLAKARVFGETIFDQRKAAAVLEQQAQLEARLVPKPDVPAVTARAAMSEVNSIGNSMRSAFSKMKDGMTLSEATKAKFKAWFARLAEIFRKIFNMKPANTRALPIDAGVSARPLTADVADAAADASTSGARSIVSSSDETVKAANVGGRSVLSSSDETVFASNLAARPPREELTGAANPPTPKFLARARVFGDTVFDKSHPPPPAVKPEVKAPEPFVPSADIIARAEQFGGSRFASQPVAV